MRQTPIPVSCRCGWRGRRVVGECACYDEYAMSCACAWGYCPRCKGRVYPTAYGYHRRLTAKGCEAQRGQR